MNYQELKHFKIAVFTPPFTADRNRFLCSKMAVPTPYSIYLDYRNRFLCSKMAAGPPIELSGLQKPVCVPRWLPAPLSSYLDYRNRFVIQDGCRPPYRIIWITETGLCSKMAASPPIELSGLQKPVCIPRWQPAPLSSYLDYRNRFVFQDGCPPRA